MHARTAVQFGERNIHVGCCLFSHNQKKTQKKEKNSEMCVLLRKLFNELMFFTQIIRDQPRV